MSGDTHTHICQRNTHAHARTHTRTHKWLVTDSGMATPQHRERQSAKPSLVKGNTNTVLCARLRISASERNLNGKVASNSLNLNENNTEILSAKTKLLASCYGFRKWSAEHLNNYASEDLPVQGGKAVKVALFEIRPRAQSTWLSPSTSTPPTLTSCIDCTWRDECGWTCS